MHEYILHTLSFSEGWGAMILALPIVHVRHDADAPSCTMVFTIYAFDMCMLSMWIHSVELGFFQLCNSFCALQMTVSAAQTMASSHGCMAFGWPTKQTLLTAVPAMYFAAALIEELSCFGGIQRSICFCVKAFYAGPHRSLLSPGSIFLCTMKCTQRYWPLNDIGRCNAPYTEFCE